MGLAGVAAGTAWAVGGVPALRTAAVTAVRLVPTLLIATGILIVLRSIAPRRGLTGPLILIAAGALGLAIQFDLLTGSMLDGLGPAALVSGGVIIAMSKRSRENPMSTIVRRHWSVFLPKKAAPRGKAPHKFILRCLFGDLVMDLTEASYPHVDWITVDITVLAGVVEVRVPADWQVRPGRLYLTRGTEFDGELSGPIPVLDDAEPPEDEHWVVINVQGWRGRVDIRRAHSVVPPPPASDLPESPSI